MSLDFLSSMHNATTSDKSIISKEQKENIYQAFQKQY